jgi:hypothetical protein
MRRTLIIFVVLLFVGVHTWANNSLYNQEHENILHVQYGGMWMQDEYLSPLLYSGQKVGIGNEWWQGFRNDSTSKWRHLGKVDATFGWMYNDRYTNLIYALGIKSGWGACYGWKWQEAGLEVNLGPYLEGELMGKMHGSNVNKPYSMDLAINLCAMGGLEWAFRANKTTYRLRYIARMNMIGMDYVPDYWHSYYEMGEGVLGNFRCAGMWNHRHLQHELTFDMQFKRSTWRVGIQHEYLEYGERNMLFSREMVSAVIGCIWDYRVSAAKDLTKW